MEIVMNKELESIANRLANARTSADVFGDMGGRSEEVLPRLKKSYHALVRAAHPDLHPAPDEQRLAQQTLKQLIEWYRIAEIQARSGSPSQKTICLQTRRHSYQVEDSYKQNGIFNDYPCRFEINGHSHPAILQVIRDPQDNELAQNEFNMLKTLEQSSEATKFSAYLPVLIEAFLYQEGGIGRLAGVFERLDGWHSLAGVHEAYPDGIDPKDMAWIWRRLLSVLGFAHRAGVIHAAVTPDNVLILPEQHGLMLVNWTLAADSREHWEQAGRIDPEYGSWYPTEMLRKGYVTYGADLGMSARCMVELLGGDPVSGWLPRSTPERLRQFFRGCLLPGRKGPQEAWALKQDFDECIERLWGERKFHPFSMPAREGL